MELKAFDWFDNDPDPRQAADTARVSRIHDPRPPLLGAVTANDVRADAMVRSSNIATDFNILHSIVQRHEGTIQKRWEKKTRQQRVNILLTAWPNMAKVHQPGFQAFVREAPLQQVTARKYREHYIWPYVNEEDLGGPRFLLSLVNARARHPPPKFAGADSGATHMGILVDVIKPAALDDYVMILNGVTGSTDYGRLRRLKSFEDYCTWVKSGRQFRPGHGLLVLEAQERLLTFLVHCCLQLLHDIPMETLTSDKFPILPERSLRADGDDAGFESLAVMAANAPYRLSGEDDLDRMESLLGAKVSAIEDHLWALREDPGYFVDHLLDVKEHRLEMVEDIYGRPHPLCRRSNEYELWRKVHASIIMLPIQNLDLFADLYEQIKTLRSLRIKYANDILPGNDLPEEYLLALHTVRVSLFCASRTPMFFLKNNIAPAMRRYFVRVLDQGHNASCPESKAQVQTRPGIKGTGPEGRLLEMLGALHDTINALGAVGLPLAVDELDRLIQAEPRARALLSTTFASRMADLSILAQCLGQVSLYQPWASCLDHGVTELADCLLQGWMDRRSALMKVNDSFHKNHIKKIVALGIPSTGKFTYPVKKRRTKETVTAMRLAEHNLDAFWSAVDHVLYSVAGAMENTPAGRLLAQPRVLQRTPAWVEPEVPVEGPRKVPVMGADVLIKPFSELFFTLSEKSREKEATPVRGKVKTRGTPRRSSNDSADPEPAESPKEPQLPSPPPSLAVDARALKVFRTLFFNPEMTTTPGEVAWNDFLHAMSSAGFGIRKLYGSAWQFAPVGTDVKAPRAIQFHEPHPRGKLGFTVARMYGRRLSRTYGWCGEMFVLEGKAG